jgi:hypothetical protein
MNWLIAANDMMVSDVKLKCYVVANKVCFDAYPAVQAMLEQRITARDEQYNYTQDPYIQVRCSRCCCACCCCALQNEICFRQAFASVLPLQSLHTSKPSLSVVLVASAKAFADNASAFP